MRRRLLRLIAGAESEQRRCDGDENAGLHWFHVFPSVVVVFIRIARKSSAKRGKRRSVIDAACHRNAGQAEIAGNQLPRWRCS
jgi:hypothetical protein